VVTPHQAARELRHHLAADLRCGVLFVRSGPDWRMTISALADTVITVPLNPDYCSLNLPNRSC